MKRIYLLFFILIFILTATSIAHAAEDEKYLYVASNESGNNFYLIKDSLVWNDKTEFSPGYIDFWVFVSYDDKAVKKLVKDEGKKELSRTAYSLWHMCFSEKDQVKIIKRIYSDKSDKTILELKGSPMWIDIERNTDIAMMAISIAKYVTGK